MLAYSGKQGDMGPVLTPHINRSASGNVTSQPIVLSMSYKAWASTRGAAQGGLIDTRRELQPQDAALGIKMSGSKEERKIHPEKERPRGAERIRGTQKMDG